MKKRQTRKQRLTRFIKRLSLYLRHGPFMLYWCFYDYLLTLWVYMKNIESVGVYVKIMSPSEKALLFKRTVVGCGYTGFTLIKIGFEKRWATTETVGNLLTHEILHQVVTRCISHETSYELDNIHKLRKNSITICEDGKVKVLWEIKFPI